MINRIITEFAFFDVVAEDLSLTELARGIGKDEVWAKTGRESVQPESAVRPVFR